MAGMGNIYSIAKDALAVSRYAMDVTAHNIANVNTPGYTRQRLITESKPSPEGALKLGQGVGAQTVNQIGDRLIENQLREQKTNLATDTEMENYMLVLEGLFNESGDTGMSAMLSQFWTYLHDVSNNPSGTPERTTLVEHSTLLANQLNQIATDLNQFQVDLGEAVGTGLETVNQITSQIANLNEQIVGMEAGGNNAANDLRDQRQELISELSQYLDVKSFEQDNGTLTVLTARGAVLVQMSSNYELTRGGGNGEKVHWEGSGGEAVDLTDHISSGKLGGWLTLRDEIAEKNELDLNSLTKEFIWNVNQQHSQGVGLNGLSTASGSYAVSDTAEELGTSDAGLDYADKIKDGSFKLWVYDSSGNVVGGGATTINIDADAGGTTLTSLQGDINTVANISASITADNKLKIDAAGGYTFAFSEDNSNVLAAVGINTFLKGSEAGDIGLAAGITADLANVAAAQVDGNGDFAVGGNSNVLTLADIQYQAVDISQWTVDRVNGNTEGTVSTTIEGYYQGMVSGIGVKSASISRSREFNEVMVKKLSETRDSISAVSLDEEMTNLMQYQSAYTAAARVMSASDEMMNTILDLVR